MLTFAWYAGLSLVTLAGVVAGVMVFVRGLAITNLTDLVPWGLWITMDLSAIAVSAGAFSLCAVVHLIGLKQYEPMARTATFIGIVGYSMAMLCLLMDVGRPDRFWHGFVFWNPHSVLWEVTMCVGLYFSVLIVENIPLIGEIEWVRRGFPALVQRTEKIHHLAPVLAFLGLAFSLLHQSSLGATYGVLQARPAWYRPSLSILFIYSAVLGGISLTLFASMLSARLTSRASVDDNLVEKLSHFIGWGLAGYLYFRFWDNFSMTYNYQPGRSEALHILTKGSLAFNFWIVEMLLGCVVPIFILLKAHWRRNPSLRITALGLIALGAVMYRWDTNLVGQMIVLTYLPQEIVARYTTYTPSLVELVSGAGVLAYGLLAFTIGVRFLRVVDKRLRQGHDEHVEQAITIPSTALSVAETVE
ncbi:MAG: polysulfide reductase NrfD [Chloroflexi bacterium]|nr:polysulfide reductase NrfD [Chloroflexota bacterium]